MHNDNNNFDGEDYNNQIVNDLPRTNHFEQNQQQASQQNAQPGNTSREIEITLDEIQRQPVQETPANNLSQSTNIDPRYPNWPSGWIE